MDLPDRSRPSMTIRAPRGGGEEEEEEGGGGEGEGIIR